MAALVLGGGVVGEAVVEALARLGPVATLTRRTHPVLARPSPRARAEILEAIEGIGATAVVNAIGRLGGGEAELTAANETWPRWLAEELAPAGGVRLVHLGSAAEYGDPGSADPVREDRPAAPTSAYGRTKWAGSAAVIGAHAAGHDTVVARVFNLAGPRLAPGSPLEDMRAGVLALGPGGGIVEVGEPETIRDLIRVEDAAAAVAALATAAEVPPVVNVCTGVALRFADLVAALARARGVEATVRRTGRAGIRAVVGDPGLLARTTGLRPEIDADGVAAACLAPEDRRGSMTAP